MGLAAPAMIFIQPRLYIRPRRRKSDADALRGDLERVGGDFHRALDKAKKNLKLY